MAVGFAITKQALDSQLGNLAVTLRNTLLEAKRLKVNVVDDSLDLTALGYSTQADRDRVTAIVLAFDKLARIAEGGEVQAAPSNFFFDARRAAGLS